MYRNIILKKSFLLYTIKRKNKNIVIKKSDKGNPVVIVDKTEHLDKMGSLVNDVSKLEKIDLKNDGYEVYCQPRKKVWQSEENRLELGQV